LEDDLTNKEVFQATPAQAGFDCRILFTKNRYEFKTSLKNSGTNIVLSQYRLVACDSISATTLLRRLQCNSPFIAVSEIMNR
jgi:hypothetical protein